MPWSGGNYTKWNGAGGWTADAAANIGIEAGRHDDQDLDFQQGIDACLNKNGQNSMTNDLNLGGNKITNLDVGVASTDAVTLGQAQAGINVEAASPAVTYTAFNTTNTPANLVLQRSNSASVGSNTLIGASQQAGQITFKGANGTGYDPVAAILGFVDGTPGASNDMPGGLIFYTTPDGSATLQERMRIKTNGFIGIGDSSPGVLLDLLRDANDTLSRVRIANQNAGSTAIAEYSLGNNSSITAAGLSLNSSTNTGGAGANGLLLYNNLGAAIRVRAGGSGGVDLASTATSWAAVSDERYKKNIQALEYGLNEILALNPIRFDYTEDSSDSSARMGFSAQAMQEVIPEAVSGSLETCLSISATELIPALVNAIKQLEARVAALEA